MSQASSISSNNNLSLQGPQESNLPKARGAGMLVAEFDSIAEKEGRNKAWYWASRLPVPEWLVLLEARRTGLNAR